MTKKQTCKKTVEVTHQPSTTTSSHASSLQKLYMAHGKKNMKRGRKTTLGSRAHTHVTHYLGLNKMQIKAVLHT